MAAQVQTSAPFFPGGASGNTEKASYDEELFWKCMDTCWKRFDMDVFWKLWNQYPAYIETVKAQAQTRQLTEEEKAYCKDLKNRLDEYLDKSREN